MNVTTKIIVSKLALIALLMFLLVMLSTKTFAKDGGVSSGHHDETQTSTHLENHVQGQAVIGEVEKVEGNRITVKNDKRQNLEVEIEKGATISGEGKRIHVFDIKKHDRVAFISSGSGEPLDEHEGTGSGEVRKVVEVFVKDATEEAKVQSKRRAVQGIITAVNGDTITIAHQIHTDQVETIQITSETTILLRRSEASGSATLSTLNVGQRVVVVGDLNTAGMIVAKRLFVIPGLAKGVFKKNPIASSSATPISSSTPVASSSATPEASSSANP